MRKFKKIIAVTACTLALQASAGQNGQASAPASKIDTAVTVVAGLATCYVFKALWNYFRTEPNYYFREAIRRRDLETIQRMLSRPDFVAKIDHNDANSVLRLAASRGHVDIVRTLIRVGADVNAYKPLHAAAKKGHVEVVRILIAANANVNAHIESNPTKLTPLDLAAKKGHTEVVRMLLEAGSTQLDWALFLAAANEHADIVKLLLQAGAKLIDDSEYNTLYEALQKGNEKIIRMLIEHAALTYNGNTPLSHAAYHDEHKLAQLLLEYDVHVDATDSMGRTPLRRTIYNSLPHVDTACVLVRHGAELAQVRNLAEYQNNPTLVGKLERLSRQRLQTIDNHWRTQLHAQGLHDDIIDECVLPLALPVSQVGELPQIRLFQATESGNVEQFRRAIHSGANVNCADENGNTPLQRAVIKGHRSITQLLLEHGAQIDTPDLRQRTALHWAAISGQEDIAGLLLEHGAEVDATDRLGYTPLHGAADKGHRSITQLLLEHGAQIDTPDLRQRTALHWAAISGQEDIAGLLLEHGAQIDSTDQVHETPLAKAARKRHSAVAETLVTRGAELARVRHLQAYQSNAALRTDLERLNRERLQTIDNHWCEQLRGQGLCNDIINGCILPLALPESQVAELTVNREDQLRQAADSGNLALLKQVIRSHVNLNAPGTQRMTALHMASSKGHTEIVRELLRAGAKPNPVNASQETPLHLATISGHEATVRLLLANGAQVNATDQWQETPLLLAANSGHCDVAQLLLAHDAQVNTTDNCEDTPLHLAADRGHCDVAQLLLAHGAQVNATDQWQKKPLHLAAGRGHCDITQLLLVNSAQVDATDQRQQTPLHLAAYRGHCDIAQLLLANSAQVDATDQRQQTPLDKAINQGHRAVAETLVTHGAELARVRHLQAYQSNAALRTALERLSKERLQTIDSQLRDRGLYNDIINEFTLPLALPQSQLNELAEIRQANVAWKTHKDLYESIE